MDDFEKERNEQLSPVPETPDMSDVSPQADARFEAIEEAAAVDVQPEVTDAAPETEEAAEEVAEAVEEAVEAVEEAAEAVEEAVETAEEAPEAVEETAEEAGPAEAGEETAPLTQEDALVQELEGIRDLLQQELDNAQGGELIQELDEVPDEPEQPEEIPEEERCKCCGEQRRDTSFGEDYPYCADCRALMKAAPFKVSSVICLILMLVVAGASLVFCTNSINDYATLMEAETYYANKMIVDAEASYYAYVSNAAYSDNYSRSAVRNLIDIFANMGYIGDANDLITQYFTDAQLKLPWNKRYVALSKEYQELSQASTKVSELLQDVMYSDASFDFDEKNAALDKLAQPAEDGTPGLSELFVEYYRFVLMSLSKQKSDEEMIAQLQHVEELDKDGTHPWLYLTNILSLASKTGDVETTRHYFDECMKLNVQESSAYTAMADVYRFTETPDPDKMLEVAASAEESLSASAVPTYLVSRAIAYLFKDDAKSATEAMETYINSGSATGQTPYTVQSCNVYALCCVVTGDDDGYAQMEDVFATADMEVSDLVKQFRKGKLTLEEVLCDNGGDI